MNIRNLKLFIAVAKVGTMTGAAKELYISQPTVSQGITEIESYYGVKLFDRLSKKLYLTEKGKTFLNYAIHIVSLYDEMEQSMKDSSKVGLIRVGASITIGTCMLQDIINLFLLEHPESKIGGITKNTREIESLIMDNQLDFALVEGIVHQEQILSKPFMEDKLILVCGKKHNFYNSEPIVIKKLDNLEFISREKGSGTRELFEKTMEENNLRYTINWECNGFDSIKYGAINGDGIAVISNLLVKNELESKELFEIKVKNFQIKRTFNLIYHKNKYISKSIEAFFNTITKWSKNK